MQVKQKRNPSFSIRKITRAKLLTRIYVEHMDGNNRSEHVGNFTVETMKCIEIPIRLLKLTKPCENHTFVTKYKSEICLQGSRRVNSLAI